MSQSITRMEAEAFIKQLNFGDLFVELGWDIGNLQTDTLVLTVDDQKFSINRVVQKRGFVVCVCDTGDQPPPSIATLRKLITKLSQHHYEHLLILHGADRQSWNVAIRPQNRPMRTVGVNWIKNQDIQPLMEKLDGIIFDISEEDTLGITDVVERVREAFIENSEAVTKKFYDKFKKQLDEFSDFIDGITKQVSKEWYAALMLNRLMFIYFIQKKNFLNGDSKYLKTKLDETKEKYGKDAFHNKFYSHFLRHLFAKGLGTPPTKRDPELGQLLGKVPYLNGGLFDLHEIEKQNENIQIPDAAFEKLFEFFEEYNWHLDNSPTATGKDINPDVIGYIFERYINDRAKMGAYYTQEDVTGYISRNTIIPFLLNRTREKCKNAFDKDNGIWRFIRENPDHYIYDAVKQGCDIPDSEIPDNIRRGIDPNKPDLLARRADWNTPTDARFALPTEIWRETIARRARYFELKKKMESGEICEIDDLITYNLDIEQFAADALRFYEGSDFIAAFYEAIAGRKKIRSNDIEKRGVTVLDPACGSGAFLFAALKILEPLYEKCIIRMREFVENDGERGKKYPQFRATLSDIAEHKNPQYWIYKTIILNNLYGVDLMKEAAEIAKLRLFLKLAAEADYDRDADNLGLEPLPDIDFNIRAGNSLVGFTNLEQVKESLTAHGGQQSIDMSGGLIKEIDEDAKLVQKAHDQFINAQDHGGDDYRTAKTDLSNELKKLNEKLNSYLAFDYGKNKKQAPDKYDEWLKSHEPFHWLAEFYGIIENDGGFDVVIGNPPYVEYSKAKKTYTVKNYEAISCGDLYALFIECALKIARSNGVISMIVPLSLVAAKRMKLATQLLEDRHSVWYSNYAWRPAKLFEEANLALSIFVAANDKAKRFTTGYQKWYANSREHLFDAVSYATGGAINNYHVPKIGNAIENNILSKMFAANHSVSKLLRVNGEPIFYKIAGGLYWKIFTNFAPKFVSGSNASSSTAEKHIKVSDSDTALVVVATLSSNLFWLWYTLISDLRNLQRADIQNFPLPPPDFNNKKLSKLGLAYLNDIKQNSEMKTRVLQIGGSVEIQSFEVKKSKPAIDKIDTVLAKHYGFTDEELDYIINYDIKYRMGLAK